MAKKFEITKSSINFFNNKINNKINSKVAGRSHSRIQSRIKFLALGLSVFSVFSNNLLSALPVQAEPSNISLTRSFKPDPIKIEGVGGGNVSLASLAGIDAKCRGFANSQPNHILQLGNNFPLLDILAYMSEINRDLTMLIKGPNGAVICADDEHQRRNPQVSRRFSQGTYQIWVGNAEQNVAVKYNLSFSESAQK